jgi:hypothetical protein
MDKPTSILAPFDAPTQFRLKLMDAGCEAIVISEGEEEKRALLAGEEYSPDQQTIAFLEFCKCFGILMNRAIDCGWVEGIQMGEVENDDGNS